MRVTVTPEQIKATFAAVSDEPAFEESSRLVADGHLPVEMLQAMSLRPEMRRAWLARCSARSE